MTNTCYLYCCICTFLIVWQITCTWSISTYHTICTSVFIRYAIGLSLDELAQFICMLIVHLFHFLIDSIRYWSLTLHTYEIYLVSKCLLQSYIGLSPRRFWLLKKLGEVTKVTVVTFSAYVCRWLGLPFNR